ncbi:MAG: dihydrofolate reductase family protein [Bacteroidota bacterium]
MTNERKVIVYIAMSLDGFIAKSDGDLAWLLKFNDAGEDYGYNEFIKTVDTVIMGRKTYDKVVEMGYEYPHGERRYIIWTHDKRPPKQNITFYSGDLKGLILDLKSRPGKNIYIDGGMTVSECMRHHLVDEYIISVIPILLGEGIPLFNAGRQEERLVLRSSKSFEAGLVQLHYINNTV